MPITVVSFQFVTGTNPYISDINQNLSISSRFVLPPDIDESGRDAIVTAVNGTITTESAICSDNALGKPRKLQFIRSSGNSMSIAVADKTTLNATATTIKGILDAANGGLNPVVCIKLIGEEFLNLNDELGVSYDGTTFASTHKAPTDALKQNYVTGVIAYEADAANTFGTVVNQGIRSITEFPGNGFSSQIADIAPGCMGPFLNIQSCGNGRRNPRKHRRFILAFATINDPSDTAADSQTETIELPISGAGALDILACGNSASGLNGLYCISYIGESHDRFHKFI